MSHFIQTNHLIIQPPAYLQGNKTSLLTYGTNEFTLGKNSSSSLVFTDEEIKSNLPLKHVKSDGSVIDYLTTSNLADLESEDATEPRSTLGHQRIALPPNPPARYIER